MSLEKPDIDPKLLQPYSSNETEDRIYKLWEESGFFNPDVCVEKGTCDKDAEAFSIVLPPPNVTGILHIGHASMLAIEDIIVRYNRMLGKKTLWLPGTDHAAIATQSMVEKELVKKEKKNRHDLGREEFLNRVETFAQKSHDTIVTQIKKMGSSVDWSREAFTLDKARQKAVYTAFKNMYNDGLIYRGYRVVNWDPKGQTTISDDEVLHKETTANVYTFKYSKDFPISIATTRPETKVGDTAVAVHPDDKRYKKYIGKEYGVDFCGTPLHIKIIADKDVDPEYGTGAVGVTPAHSIIDYKIAKRHNLPLVQVINEYARMTVDNPELKDKKTLEARDIIVEWLDKEGLLENTEEVQQNISIAERTGCTIEPLPKTQWWIDVNKEFILKKSNVDGIPSGSSVTLKQLMTKVVKNSQIKILPERFDKTYFHWIDNLDDWCISRQIWYGHRIPVWYKGDEIYCDINPPEGNDWEQDEDTLDTWFSSGLWTFSTLGWPDDTQDLKTYHPTNILETGYDILFFWVARMILMSTYHLGTIPFEYVYLHGLVRDGQGRKMSKSLGNVINPLDVIEKYGADATRISLIIGTTPGNDANISDDKIRAYKKFGNKIWNISRFILDNTAGVNYENKPELAKKDSELIAELDGVVAEITDYLNTYKLHLAGEKLYHYIWHNLADVILEESKVILSDKDHTDFESRRWTLLHILSTSLKLLHPFMPFITEEVWGMLPGAKNNKLLIVESWPKP